jgi:TldD protein
MRRGWPRRPWRCWARPRARAGTTLVLCPEQLALQVHESIGHALELDRILLCEASWAV